MKKKLIIFTDLDETLLERHTYSFAKARSALKLLKDKDIPLIIATSKTVSETEHYRKKLDNRHPFISENGGGIFIPAGYFDDLLDFTTERQGDYDVITLGTPYERLREALSGLRGEGFDVRGFGDMAPEEIMEITGLTLEESKLSLRRNFDEPFVCGGCDTGALKKAIEARGLTFTEGRFYHITGENDKGNAVDVLKKLYKSRFGDIATAALGDSPTDISMLRHVDYPVVIQKDDGTYDPRLLSEGVIRAVGVGPKGWNKAVLDLVKSLDA